MACEQDYWNQMYANACDQGAPSLLWRPRLFIDGNQWCALYGENIQDGVAGFGDTPAAAMRDFDLNWNEQKPLIKGQAIGYRCVAVDVQEKPNANVTGLAPEGDKS